MAKLKPWYQVVTPREDLRENRPLDASEFAVHLDHIREKRAHDDYVKPERFFDRTYLTRSLLDLSAQVVRRLSGNKVETSAVFNMATQFGGGKTHALTVLYHLAKGGEKAKAWKGVESILQQAQVGRVPSADVAVLVGTEFDVLKGRGGEGEPVRKTPWGEIAWQLGKHKAFAAVAAHDEKMIAPAGDVLREMLPAGPVLILMDELINYVSRGRKMGLRDQFFNFLQNLSEEARARDNMVVCVSIPASELEMNPDDQRDQDALKKLLDRLGKAILMSAESEAAEIIRRRLFEWHGLPEEAKATARAYAGWAADNAAAISGFNIEAAYEEFLACYPFHPSVLSVFERKWQSLPRFQRTRGILRLLALWISRAYQDEHRQAAREPLIGLGSAPLDDPTFRAAAFEQLGSDRLEVPVTTDIAGKKDAHAVKLDGAAGESIRKARLHRKVATTIFFESNGGMSQTQAEATVPEIKGAVGEPEVLLTEVDQVLETLVSTCYYLTWTRNRYRFSLSPNLNQMLVTKRAAVQKPAIDERVRQEIETVFKAGSPAEIDRRYWPARSNDVPDRASLTLLVLGMDTVAGEASTTKLMETIVRESGTFGRTFKSALIFAVPDAAAAVNDAARNLLAWTDIDDDEESKKRLDDSQQRLLTHNLGRAKADLKEAVWRAYRHLFLLGRDNKLRDMDLGQITSSQATSIVELILRELQRSDEVTDSVGASRLVKFWPGACVEWSTKAVRDAFYSSPLLPRLLKPDSIKRTIADGVSQGVLGYGRRDVAGQWLGRYAESLPEEGVEIADDVFIVTGDEAKRRKEPPKLARIAIRPERVIIKPGEQAAFSVVGFDQYGQPFPAADAAWQATGGHIDATGLFVAGTAAGVHTAKAAIGSLDAVAEVRITEPSAGGGSDDGGREGTGGEGRGQKIVWSGEVKSQKWMNLYTKVLSKFANMPGLKIVVHFEVPLEGEQAKTAAEQARTGLRELGLNDDVRQD